MNKLVYFINIIFLINLTDTAKILCVFPIPYRSHQQVLRVIAEGLVDRGHEVVVITPDPHEDKKENLTEIDVREISNKVWDEEFKKEMKSLEMLGIATNFVSVAFKLVYAVFEAQLASNEVQKLIKSKDHFDLIIAQDYGRPAVLFASKFKAPIVLISTSVVIHESFHHVGSEIHPFLYPLWTKVPQNIYERIFTFIECWKNNKVMDLNHKDNEFLKKYFDEKVISVEELRKNVKMVLLPLYRMWDNNRAVTAAVTHMGTIHIKDPKPLPEDLKNYTDNSKNGVIYMSLGSKFQSSDLPPHVIKVILGVFSSLPYDVIWKWNADSMVDQPDNLRLEKWLPQADLLRHPSLKLFITHCGLQSTTESVAAGVPMLMFPLMSDQYRNAQILQQCGAGLVLDINNFQEQEFKKAIQEIIENNEYRDNIRRLHSLLQDEQLNGLELALSRIDLLLDRGWSPTGPAADVTFADYFMLDVFLPLVLALMILIILQVIVFQRIFKFLICWCGRNKSEISRLANGNNERKCC